MINWKVLNFLVCPTFLNVVHEIVTHVSYLDVNFSGSAKMQLIWYDRQVDLFFTK